jgi:hypothetical protein
VHRYLVTASLGVKFDLWSVTGGYANWLEGRENGDRETWLVTVLGADSARFLRHARLFGATVEEVHGGGDSESYTLVVGEPMTGWARRGI